MTAVEVREVTESLRALGIAVVADEPEVDEDLPVVSWEDDLQGFLEAAKDLEPAEAYVGPLTIDDDLVSSLEDDDDLDESERASLKKILDEARALVGQEVGTQSIFLADHMMHEYYSLIPAAHDLFERIEQFADALADDDACGCGHDHEHEHDHGHAELKVVAAE
ncbi:MULTISPECIES: hypothetical protein [unclassified Pseudofrankia]|uniref:hypothetical protein n=1 Tax=unclassified Pseudofrankia TaxID=2994372 RepID=UPI0008D993E4|nr:MULTISPECIES: hypothetical protein [unclassified Pseudofrankia]MDT3439519.1 hypothetical protein [Pseudofrankia sp. BMG5.37]OHV48706.1 hypothetical protein BCD48_14820 [Pseudofrankia sp. BMG5.36]